MRVHVEAIGGHPLAETVRSLATHAARHELDPSPSTADLVLLCGTFTRDPHSLTRHRLYLTCREKCAVYTGDDAYLPLAPGVYTSPRRGLSTRLGRVRSYGFVSSYGLHANQAVNEASRGSGSQRQRERRLLFSFEGSPTSRLRRRLFSFSFDPALALVRDTTTSYSHFDHAATGRQSGQARYVETMLDSRFVLCPRGVGTGTLRLFESMSLGVAPVLLSDDYVLPRGPRWDTFLVRVRESRLSGLPDALAAISASSATRGELARRAWEAWFAPEVAFDNLVDAAGAALSAGPVVQALYRRLEPVLVGSFRLRTHGIGMAGRIASRLRSHPPR